MNGLKVLWLRQTCLAVTTVVTVGALAICAPVHAATIAISVNNPSFESTATTLTNSGSEGDWSVNTLEGWNVVTLNPAGPQAGNLQPTLGALNTNPFTFVPDGVRTAWSTGAGLTQTTSEIIEQGLTYQLWVDIGDRKDTIALGGDVPFGGGRIQLFSSIDGVLATEELGTGPGNGNWATYTTFFLAGVNPSGALLGIRLKGDLQQVNFDNVRLSIVPLPAALISFVTALLGFGFVGRTRRN